jgi:outer membrane immunogenic protein
MRGLHDEARSNRRSGFGVALALATISTSVLAADLGAGAPAAYTKAPAYELVRNWTGLYIGGNVGYGWGNTNIDFDNGLGSEATFTEGVRPKGVIGGGQIGYNWQIGSFLAGVETDIQGSGIKGAASGVDVAPADQRLSWFGTVRGRIGVLATPELLLYGTGGLAYGDASGFASEIATSGGGVIVAQAPASFSGTRTGWAAGGGAEWMFTRGWSAKIEYLHIDLGNAHATVNDPVLFGIVNYTWRNQYDTVRFGVNYHFN